MSSDPGNPTIPIRLFPAGPAVWHPAVALAILLLLILAGAFFTAAKTAILSLNKVRLEKLAESSGEKAKKLLSVTENSARLLPAARGGAALAGLLASAVAAVGFSAQLAGLLLFLPFPPSVLRGIATVLITLLVFCVWAVFGYLIPQKSAPGRAKALVFRSAGILSALSFLFRPAGRLLSSCANRAAKLSGANSSGEGQAVTEEELLMMVDSGRRDGLLDDNEKDMISNIFEFSDATADEAMTHRTDVVAVKDTDSVEDIVEVSMKNGCSRIPVYHGNLDHVAGMIYVKDLLPYVGKSIPPSLLPSSLMRPAYFVPKTKSCGVLFSEMRARRIQIAVVVDEFGGTEGIITMEDLLESIVGNIQDEYDKEEEEIHRDGENRFDVEGTTPVDEVSDLLGVDLPEGDYDTIAGLMMDRLGRLPRENEHPQVRLKGLTLTVSAMEERRIAKIRIEKDPPLPAGRQPKKPAASGEKKAKRRPKKKS